MNKELGKNTGFINLAMELFRFTESYACNVSDSIPENQYLLTSNLILDFKRDLNIREVEFVEIYEKYKNVIRKLSYFNCLNCPKFIEHVKIINIYL